MKNECLNSAMQLAKDASGITVYKLVQAEKNSNMPNVLRKPVGLLFAAREAILPTRSRYDREIPYKSDDRIDRVNRLLACASRDCTTITLPSISFWVVASATQNGLAALATYLLTKFILNGIIHYEFQKYHNQNPAL